MGESSFLAHSQAYSQLSYTVQDPGNGAAHSCLGSPTSINNQDKSPQTQPQASVIWEVPQMGLPSQMTLGYVTWTFKMTWSTREPQLSNLPQRVVLSITGHHHLGSSLACKAV